MLAVPNFCGKAGTSGTASKTNFAIYEGQRRAVFTEHGQVFKYPQQAFRLYEQIFKYVIPGHWYQASGTRSQVPVTRYLVPDICYPNKRSDVLKPNAQMFIANPVIYGSTCGLGEHISASVPLIEICEVLLVGRKLYLKDKLVYVGEGPIPNATKSLGRVNPRSGSSSAGSSLGGLTPPVVVLGG
jgi:hypothetical protein